MRKNFTLPNLIKMKYGEQSVYSFQAIIEEQLKTWENSYYALESRISNCNWMTYSSIGYYYESDKVVIEFTFELEEEMRVKFKFKGTSFMWLLDFNIDLVLEALWRVIYKKGTDLKDEDFDTIWEKYYKDAYIHDELSEYVTFIIEK